MATEMDELTGVLNYASFLRGLEEGIKEADGEGEEMSLAFIDIDYFKFLNDHLGHEAGDEIIRATAQRLEAAVGEAGRVYRYGGDEFAVLLPGMEREQALLFLEGFRSGFDLTREVETEEGKEQRKVTLSVGIAAFPTDGETEKQLVSMADDALYRAKATNRNKVCLAREEKMVTKTSHYTRGQLKRLNQLSKKEGVGEAVLLREALDDLLRKYDHLPAARGQR
ncbi:MAG: diguanylate cyclase [Planctomycetota bacterium]